MPIYPFERIVYPVRLPSPFVGRGGLKGKETGGLVAGEAAEPPIASEDIHEQPRRSSRTKGTTGVTPSNPTTQPFYQLAPHPQQPQYAHVPRTHGPDRSVITAAGGMAALGVGAIVEKLPPETAKHFDRNVETNEVLWFPAPPVDTARPVKPKYSIEYLHFLAMKRKRDLAEAEISGSESHPPTAKRDRPFVPPT